MELLSLSKMITAELRSSLPLASDAETPWGIGVRSLDSFLPLPMWRDVSGGCLSYWCPIARLLAAQNHLDGNLLACRWQASMMAARQQITSDGGEAPSPISASDGDYLSRSMPRFFLEEIPVEAEGDLLRWTIGDQCIRRWLVTEAFSIAWKNDWLAEKSPLYAVTEFDKRRTAAREFDWQLSYISSHRLIRFLEDAPRLFLLESRGNMHQLKAPEASPIRESRSFAGLDSESLLPLVLAQMTVVDAMDSAPQQLMSAVDQLSCAWRGWLSTQTLGDLRLRQMAYPFLLADIVNRNHTLIGLSISAVFGREPVEQW